LVALDETEQTVLVGVDCEDHPGLLMRTSDGIGQQGYNLKHSEAKVIGDRSLSVWRCEAPHTATASGTTLPDLDELWSNIYAVLKAADMDLVANKSGERVVQAYVTNASSRWASGLSRNVQGVDRGLPNEGEELHAGRGDQRR
jgi:hypothetical protein